MPPVNLNGIFASYSSIDWRPGLLTYVKTFIQRKPEGRRLLNSTFTHHLSIDRKSSFPAFADASAVVVEQDRFAEMVGSKKKGLRTQDGVQDERGRKDQGCFFKCARARKMRVKRRIVEIYRGFLDVFGALENRQDQRICPSHRKVVSGDIS